MFVPPLIGALQFRHNQLNYEQQQLGTVQRRISNGPISVKRLRALLLEMLGKLVRRCCDAQHIDGAPSQAQNGATCVHVVPIEYPG